MLYQFSFLVVCLISLVASHQNAPIAQRIYGVIIGNVKYTPPYNSLTTNYYLDYVETINQADSSWSAKINDQNQWIQVSTQEPKLWTSIIIQGRGDFDQWVKQYKVTYSLDGNTFMNVDNGALFSGNTDQNSKVQNQFEKPVSARILRLHPVSWNKHISLRWEAVYLA